MSHPVTSWDSAITALDGRSELIRIEEERAHALRAGPGSRGAHMTELEAGLEYRRRLYVAAAVTETLRAEHFGPQTGRYE